MSHRTHTFLPVLPAWPSTLKQHLRQQWETDVEGKKQRKSSQDSIINIVCHRCHFWYLLRRGVKLICNFSCFFWFFFEHLHIKHLNITKKRNGEMLLDLCWNLCQSERYWTALKGLDGRLVDWLIASPDIGFKINYWLSASTPTSTHIITDKITGCCFLD